jgi:hypothetical protein
MIQMTSAKELAARLNGREYGNEITKEEEAEAKQNNLVVCFGYSDDITEFRGAIDEECGAGDDASHEFFWHSRTSKFRVITQREDYNNLIANGWVPPKIWFSVRVEWCPDDVKTSWRLTSSIPYESFEIYEDGDLYCIGCVFEAPLPADKS